MNFIEAAEELLAKLPVGYDYVILSYLLREAVGVANAKPWTSISRHLLEVHQVKLRPQTFQEGLLKKSREGPAFIGSDPRRGYFIIETPEDLKVAEEFITTRIAQQQARLEVLRGAGLQTFGRESSDCRLESPHC